MVLTGLLIGVWAVWLRPESLGGRTGYMIVGGQSMVPALRGGDLVVVRRRAEYKVGDVVAYRIPAGVLRGRRIIHRIVAGDATGGFVLRGDNKAEDDQWRPRAPDIEGRLWKRVPYAGMVVAFARAPAVLAAVAGGFAFATAMAWKPRVRRQDESQPGEPSGSAESAQKAS